MLRELDILITVVVVIHYMLFSVFLLISKKSSHASNRFLSVFLLSEALVSLNHMIFLYWAVFYKHFPHAFMVLGVFAFLKGPALFFYVKSLTFRDFHLKRSDVVHLVPFIFAIVYIGVIFVFRTTHAKRVLLDSPEFWSSPYLFLYWGALHLLVILYVCYSIFLLGKYGGILRQQVSSLGKIGLPWVRFLLYSFVAMWSMWFLNFLFDFAGSGRIHAIDLAGNVILFITANIVIYFGLHLPELFVGIEEKPKYKSSPLENAEKDRYLEKLVAFMENEKPYLNPSLTLNELAGELAIVPRHLSQVINESLGKNFYDFVNGYRIEEAKHMLLDSSIRDRTVLEILYDVGFNSKSAFNLAFKNNTGMTPTQYRRSASGAVPA